MASESTRPVATTERSGVLEPGNLARFAARWITPSPGVREVVDTYWSVQWHLDEGESIDQRIIDHPSITLSIEHGEVLAPFVVSAARSRAWRRTITGSGEVFAVRLRPAGLAVLTDLAPGGLVAEQPITPERDDRSHRLLRQVALVPDADGRAQRADALIGDLLRARPPTDRHRLANRALDHLTEQPRVRPVADVAAHLRTSPRSLQRALAETLGRGPGDIARRIRLQEVVRRLSSGDSGIAEVAAGLGYADQAHLTNEFRTVTGMTPGAYMDALRRAG